MDRKDASAKRVVIYDKNLSFTGGQLIEPFMARMVFTVIFSRVLGSQGLGEVVVAPTKCI